MNASSRDVHAPLPDTPSTGKHRSVSPAAYRPQTNTSSARTHGHSIMAVELARNTGEAAMPGLYFGEELAYWIYEKGCSPAAIANKLGRSEDAVRKWIKQ